jgi:hypothetical protein
MECNKFPPRGNFIITSAAVAEALNNISSKPLPEKETEVLNKTYKKTLSKDPTKFE